VTTYREVDEVLRRGKDFRVNGTRQDSAEFLHGTVIDIDGAQHRARRRFLNRMIGPTQPWGAQGPLFTDVFEQSVRELREGAAGEAVSFDLIEFMEGIYWRTLAHMIGIDGADTPERLNALRALLKPVQDAAKIDYVPGDHSAALARIRTAIGQLREEFFDPSYEHRRKLIAAAGDDPLLREELPGDLITSMLLEAGGEPDTALIVREIGVFAGASIKNPVAQAAWGMLELEKWLEAHPEDRERLDDPDFFDLVTKETLRLHRVGRAYLPRYCPEVAVLESSGLEIPAGSWVAVWLQPANKDTAVFGPDAAEFNPHRTIADASVNRFGIAFGTGPHACLGRPLLVWDGGGAQTQGSLARILGALVGLGITTDPNGVQEVQGLEESCSHKRYDVLLPAAVD
jgi:cytochrome P450